MSMHQFKIVAIADGNFGVEAIKILIRMRDKFEAGGRGVDAGDVKALKGFIQTMGPDEPDARQVIDVLSLCSRCGSSEAQDFLEGQISSLLSRRVSPGESFIKITSKDRHIIQGVLGSFRQVSLIPLIAQRSIDPSVRQWVTSELGRKGIIDSAYAVERWRGLNVEIISEFYSRFGFVPPHALMKALQGGDISFEKMSDLSKQLEVIDVIHNVRERITLLSQDKELQLAYYCFRQAPFTYPGTATMSFERFETIIELTQASFEKEGDAAGNALQAGFIQAGMREEDAQEIVELLMKGGPPLPVHSPYREVDGHFKPIEIPLVPDEVAEHRDKRDSRQAFNSARDNMERLLEVHELYGMVQNRIKKLSRKKTQAMVTWTQKLRIIENEFDMGPARLPAIYEQLLHLHHEISPRTRDRVQVEVKDRILQILFRLTSKDLAPGTKSPFHHILGHRGPVRSARHLSFQQIELNEIVERVGRVIRGPKADPSEQISEDMIYVQFSFFIRGIADVGGIKNKKLNKMFDEIKGDMDQPVMERIFDELRRQTRPVSEPPVVGPVYLDYVHKWDFFEILRFSDGAHCCNSLDPAVNRAYGDNIYPENAHRWPSDGMTFFFQVSTQPRRGKQIGWLKCWFGLGSDGKPFVGSNFLYLTPAYKKEHVMKPILKEVEEILASIHVAALAQAQPAHIPHNSIAPTHYPLGSLEQFIRLQSLEDGQPSKADVMFPPNQVITEPALFYVKMLGEETGAPGFQVKKIEDKNTGKNLKDVALAS